jgi:general secretion pathway protein G
MRRAGGFTFIEVLITVAIVAALASIALPLSEVAIQRGKETQLRRALQQIRDAIDAYKRASDEGRIVRSTDQSGYPPTLKVLVDGVTDARNPTGAKIYFLRRIPRDPMHREQDTPPESTWGLRSYESTWNDPKPGKDVFDVYSRSDRLGLNRLRYREW